VLNKNKSFLVALFWTLLVTVLSLISISSLSGFGNNIHIANKDKIVHFIFYFVMVILWMYYFSKVQIANKGLKIVLGAILYGIVMEICQEVFTTYRSADIVDVVANSSGALSGFFLYITIKAKK
jgi:VanZ family protein